MSFYSELEKYGNHIALLEDSGRRVSYAQLAELADNAAALTIKQYENTQTGFPDGARFTVFILCKNSIDCIALYLSCLRTGNVPLLLDRDLERGLLSGLLKNYEPDFIFLPRQNARLHLQTPDHEAVTGNNPQSELSGSPAGKEADRTSTNIHGSSLGLSADKEADRISTNIHGSALGSPGGEGDDVTFADMAFAEEIVEFEAYTPVDCFGAYLILRRDLDCPQKRIELYKDLALLLTTSGSTGSPKLVRLSKNNIQVNAMQICNYLSLNSHERPITTLPMQYTYGLSIINSHLAIGATILLTEQAIIQKGFWEFLRKENATSFGGVPYTYQTLKRLGLSRLDFGSVKYMTQAGGRLDKDLNAELVRFCKHTGRRFIVMYGQTEATARMSYVPWDNAQEKAGSIGIAVPGGRFCIDGDKSTGELIYEGPNVSLGSAESGKDLAKGDEFGGYLRTGDLAIRDSDGFYYIVGRVKRFIKLFGKRVNLDDVEKLCASAISYPCVCVGNDEKLLAYYCMPEEPLPLEKSGNAKSPADKLTKLLSGKLNLPRSCFEIRQIDSIPLTSSGKIDYHAILQNHKA